MKKRMGGCFVRCGCWFPVRFGPAQPVKKWWFVDIIITRFASEGQLQPDKRLPSALSTMTTSNGDLLKRPRIAVTMGDPAGVGPEICLKMLADPAVAECCHPIVFGDTFVLESVARQCGLPLPKLICHSGDISDCDEIQSPALFSTGDSDRLNVNSGTVTAETGARSFDYINTAIDAALAGHVDAVTTGPINKEAWQMAGVKHPGHTELFAERSATARFCMMMTSPSFSCSLVTTHVGYYEVPGLLTSERILEVIELTHEALGLIVGRPPKLVVLGLNPHAGEGGLFGKREEEMIIGPAVTAAQQRGIDIEGPLPPDTAFLPWRREATDGFICMYHDQGLIPFKALNFETGVNITLGLPLIRTSVDHGTALDIAGQGKADESSLISAVRLAARLAAG